MLALRAEDEREAAGSVTERMMTKKTLLLLPALVALIGASGVALAQDETDIETQDRFMRMHEMSEAFDSAMDPMQRRTLMHDHMMLMQEQMNETDGMMMGGHMMHGGEAPHDGDVDLAALQAQMRTMHQMMSELMTQQQMMMQLDEHDEDTEE